MDSLKLFFLFIIYTCSIELSAQRIISGSVTDENDEPLIGVNIIVSEAETGTSTDEEGFYTIETPQTGILIFSYIGYATVSRDIGTSNVIDVTMQTLTQEFEEVVVNALGFVQRKDEMGSTYATIRTEDINRSGEILFLNTLDAKASNVQISRSNGDPGAGTTIRIRGANTILGSSNPLIILDGVPVSNETIYGGGNLISGGRDAGVSQQSRINDLNPNNIESIQILKGASAAALWGSRAANGVLVITTKTGRSVRLHINYKSSFSLDKVHERIPMQSIFGQGAGGRYAPNATESWGDYIPGRAGGADEVRTDLDRFVTEDGTTYYPITNKNSKQTFVDENWDAAFQTGQSWQNDLSISGGNDRSTYYFSLGRVDQEGIIRNSDYVRTNLRLNNKFFLSDWLSISSKAGYMGSSSNRIQQSSNVTGLLLGLQRTPPDFDNRPYKGTYFDRNGVAYPGRHRSYRLYLGGFSSNPIYNNPLWTIYEQEASSTVNRFIMSAEMNITPANWLQFTLRGGIDNYEDDRVYFFPIFSASDRNSGVLDEDIITEKELNFDAIARMNFRVHPDVSAVATLGWNINDQDAEYSIHEVRNFQVHSTKKTTDLNTAAESSTVSNTKRLIRSNRGYGIVSFDLFDQLFVSVSGGLEAASSVKGRFFYPAVDAAWQFTEKFGKSDILSFGKIRASWGKVGVQPLPHRFETLAESGFGYFTYSDPLYISLFSGGFRINDDKNNPDLEPEIKEEWEIGADLRLFNDALSLFMTYYKNTINGMLLDVTLTPSSGFDSEYRNAGSMENRGFEMELDYALLRNKEMDLGIFANFGTNKNEVTSLSGTGSVDLSSGSSVSSRAIQGYPLGTLYGTGSLTDDNGKFILDENGFPIITPSPVVLGDPNPDWTGGLGIRAQWKNFSFDALLEHSQGGDFSPRTLWVLRRFGTTKETASRVTLTQDLVNYAGEVIPANTTVRGKVEDFGGGPVLLDESWYRTGIGGGLGDQQAYNFSIVDATYTRLREVSLGYTFHSGGFKAKSGLNSITMRISGRNLFLWDEIEGIDPEINQYGVSNGFGLDYFTNPSTKSYLFSIIVDY